MAHSMKTADFFLESRMIDAAAGNVNALYELGVAFSSGSAGTNIDLIQAHKWFNLAAVSGDERAKYCRAEIADDMTAREIAEAQRQARAWVEATIRRAA
jgi:TPR repeat protein